MGSTGDVSETPSDRSTAPRWGLAAGLLLVVSAVVYGFAQAAPFKPSARPAAAGGDAVRGEALFATNCAVCHGDKGAGGGIGPTLAGVPREPGAIASVIAAGKGAMPAGLVAGTDAADVVAYVVSIGGGAGTTTTAGTPPAPAGAQAGRATFVGDRLQGLRIRLNEPAPTGWAVWVNGPAGPRRVAAIAPGTQTVDVSDAGRGSLVDGTDAVVVGKTAEAPALRAEVPGGLSELLVRSASPGKASLLTAAAGQAKVLDDHIRFLRQALRERNLANVRFHSEHLVNISRGDPVVDLDENGEASNPGDGIGLIGQPDRVGYLPRILAVGGPDLVRADALILTITGIARGAEQCAARPQFTSGPCLEPVARKVDALNGWEGVAADIRVTATVSLVTTG
jgi:mono/diheme cytochrome c family protein